MEINCSSARVLRDKMSWIEFIGEYMSEVSEHKKEEKRPKLALANVSKVIELQAESTKSWEDAVQLCLAEAVRTVRNINTISVSEFTASVKDDSVQRYQARCKVSFAIDDAMRAH